MVRANRVFQSLMPLNRSIRAFAFENPLTGFSPAVVENRNPPAVNRGGLQTSGARDRQAGSRSHGRPSFVTPESSRAGSLGMR